MPRCAIYTRKSADERVDSQLSSIERQRELCEAYIASQVDEAWIALPEAYADLGYSGGNLRRPALTRLLAAIDAGEVDVVVIYKIDRLTRSLRDFLDLLTLFEARGVALVAITQHFATNSSMGRLTLNVLLSFAQFERELTSERLRDWFAGARARGLWVNGPAPYGYRVEDLRLHVREDQAEVIRYIYRRYPVLGSSRALAREINACGHLNKVGRPFGGHAVMTLLQNRLYRGEMPHRGGYSPGQHDAIVTEAQWRRVQTVIAQSARRRATLVRPQVHGMLKGIVYAPHGPLIHVFVHRRSQTYRYYIASVARWQADGERYRAADIEQAVADALIRLTGSLPTDPYQLEGAIRRLIERVDLEGDRMTIRLLTGAEIAVGHTGLIRARMSRRRPDGSRLLDGRG